MSQFCYGSFNAGLASQKTSPEEWLSFPELALDCLGLNECIYTLSNLLRAHEERSGTPAEKAETSKAARIVFVSHKPSPCGTFACSTRYRPLELVTPYSFCYPGEDPPRQQSLFKSCVTYSLNCLGRYESPSPPEKLSKTLGRFCEELGVRELSQIDDTDLLEGYGEVPCKLVYLLLRKAVEAKGISSESIATEEPASKAVDDPVEVEDFAEYFAGSTEETEKTSLPQQDVGTTELNSLECSVPPSDSLVNIDDDPIQARNAEDAVRHGLDAEGVYTGEELTWRVHLEETCRYKQLFDECLETVGEALQNQQKEIQTMLTRVEEKERWLQRQFSDKAEEHMNLRTALDSQAALYNELVEKKRSLEATLASTQQQLQQRSKMLEQKYNKVTDTQPLEDLKSTLKRMKEEIKQMDVRIGVLMHANLREAIRVRNVKGSGSLDEEDAKGDGHFGSFL